MSNHKLLGKSFVRKPQDPAGPISIVQQNSKVGVPPTHSFTGVPAGAMLVLVTTCQYSAGQNATVTSNPSLAWTKRVDAEGTSGGAEIHTATFSAGGSINITSNWGANFYQASTCYVLTGVEAVPAGVFGSATAQSQPLVSVTSTKADSVVFCGSSDWNAVVGTTVYRGSPVESFTATNVSAAKFRHYYYEVASPSLLDAGFTSPNTSGGTGTAVLEIRTGTPVAPDSTPPSAPVLSTGTVTPTSIAISWTAATDNVGVTGYEVYLNGVLQNTIIVRSYTFSSLTPSTLYTIKVRAKDAAGNGTDSNTVTPTTGFTDVTPPSAPVATLGTVSANTVSLSWTASTDNVGIAGYEIYVNGVYNAVTSSSLLNFTVTGLTASTPYALRVKAIDAASNGTDSNTLNTTTLSAGTGTAFSYTIIPYSDPDIPNPGRGAEEWHSTSAAVPGITNTDYYQRSFIRWSELEPTKGVYNFTAIDSRVDACIAARRNFSFGVMTVHTGNGPVTYDGGNSCYPQWLHAEMQALPAADRDWKATWTDNSWIPNWNSRPYLDNWRLLMRAINTHLNTTSVSGFTRKTAVYAVDIRGYGNYGEWNHGGISNTWTAGGTGNWPTVNVRPTEASLIEIIDIYRQEFPDVPLVAMIAAFDGGFTGIPLFPPYPKVSDYVLNASNAWGRIGARRDQIGATDSYLDPMLKGNTTVYPTSSGGSGIPFNTLILNKYQTAPFTGEPPGYQPSSSFPRYYDLERQVIDYKQVSFGNGNWGMTMDAGENAEAIKGFKRSGFRLQVNNGTAPTTATGGVAFNISMTWQNTGLTPTYQNWQVVFELQTLAGAVVFSHTSSKVLKLFLPSAGAVTTTDTLVIPNTVPEDTYKLVFRVKDPRNYLPNMNLAIQGQNADKSYTIRGSFFFQRSLRITGKIPYTEYFSRYAYQPDASENNYAVWFNGTLEDSYNLSPTSSSLKNLIDPFVTMITFPPEMDVTLETFRLYHGVGTSPRISFTLILKNGTQVPGIIPDFTGTGLRNWTQTTIPAAYQDIKAIKLVRTNSNANANWGIGYFTELEFIGSYIPFNPTYPTPTRVPLKNMFGVNSFPWNNGGDSAPGDPEAIERLARYTGIGWNRAYDDWPLFQSTSAADYRFAPTFTGGWNQDEGFSRLKAIGVKNIQCIKQCPAWIYRTYPWNASNSHRDSENAYHRYKGNIAIYTNLASFPVSGATNATNFPETSGESTVYVADDTDLAYDWNGSSYVLRTANSSTKHFSVYTQADVDAGMTGAVLGKIRTYYNEYLNSDRLLPSTYIEFAQMGFQSAARYGTNASVNTSLVLTPDDVRGLDIVDGIEAGNEMNAHWKGRKRFLNGFEYAACLSAFYDGHKGTMGTRAGVKTADPNLNVYAGGIAAANPVYYRQMFEWCRENRGYLPNGEINICWDVIKFHSYSNSSGLEQFSAAVRYAIPVDKNDIVGPRVQAFKDLSYELLGRHLPCHIGETGYDVGPSPQGAAVVYATDATTVLRTRMQSQGNWILRDMIEYNYWGLDAIQFYLLIDPSAGIGDPYTEGSLYLTSGFYSRSDAPVPDEVRVAAWFGKQFSALVGADTVESKISNSPRVYKLKNGSIEDYALWNPEYIIGGVSEGGIYKSAVTINFDGTATLNANPFLSGSVVNTNGSYTLIVTDPVGVVRTITFTYDTTAVSATGKAATFFTNPVLYTLSLPGITSITRYDFSQTSDTPVQTVIPISGSYNVTVNEQPIFIRTTV